MILLSLAACAPENTELDPGFHVVGVSPEDGAADVVEAHLPELRFSDAVSPEACGAEALRLDGIHADDTVAFAVPLVVVALDGGVRIQLTHPEPLPRGWSYALSAHAGDSSGCVDLDGRTLAPFASTFTVP